MEFFDIYTAGGQRTGRTAPKGTVCTSGDYFLGVHIYIYDSRGRFLLQQRAENKSFRPGEWDIHMGHAMTGETSLEAACRELEEELGVGFTPEQMIHVARTVWKQNNSLVDIYFIQADLDETRLHLQKEEVISAKWVKKEEMISFIRAMSSYRPEHYRQIVLQYIADIL